ncbi:polypeptide N-acetylgalactosaminyltransferase 5 isoform X1 [Aplysia californica]|uniref:Polypeptide N-acetylgalactosaminyltransferase 5 isoform X1 n=1 Tax=Aplysia californica TaxID=6500 RepID=A0ABM1AB50_APLCA|nr:polypeptide N-acetylgalactosaminyltransferase 5 isoform X1 [Aplysia californica]
MDWNLIFNWMSMTPPDGRERKTWADPVKMPTHLGCCFAVSKNNFNRLGGYDPELQIWGCENMELSFKAWMCGGSIEMIPCSHVGHMFRVLLPFSVGQNFDRTLTRNCLRVAEVWMDEYREIYRERIGPQMVSTERFTVRDLP